jgi:hypothetical protein
MSSHSRGFIVIPEQFCPKLDTMLYAQKLSMSGRQESEVWIQKTGAGRHVMDRNNPESKTQKRPV